MARSTTDYEKQAAECRALARMMKHSDQRDALLHMADTWDKLARFHNERGAGRRSSNGRIACNGNGYDIS